MRNPIIYEHAGEEIKRCKCGRRIFFKLMKSGRTMPVTFDSGETHFAICRYADTYRRRKK